MKSGNLYIVATPIGNLRDITFRAVETLKEVDVVVCEDTRQTRKLLNHYKIKKPVLSCHQHSNEKKLQSLIDKMKNGESIAYVSDAGTPNISDPGGKLVEMAFNEGIKTIPIPGVSALTAIISVSGIQMDEFCFLGFIPHKKGRQKIFKKIQESSVPVVFFESKHRIKKTLESLSNLIPERNIIIGRELTKMFETIYKGNIKMINVEFENIVKIKGEFVIIINKR